jgi:hypothetical protein
MKDRELLELYAVQRNLEDPHPPFVKGEFRDIVSGQNYDMHRRF